MRKNGGREQHYKKAWEKLYIGLFHKAPFADEAVNPATHQTFEQSQLQGMFWCMAWAYHKYGKGGNKKVNRGAGLHIHDNLSDKDYSAFRLLIGGCHRLNSSYSPFLFAMKLLATKLRGKQVCKARSAVLEPIP